MLTDRGKIEKFLDDIYDEWSGLNWQGLRRLLTKRLDEALLSTGGLSEMQKSEGTRMATYIPLQKEIVTKIGRPTIDEMEDFVGGHMIPIGKLRYNNRKATAIVNASSKFLALAVNERASELLDTTLLGPVIILQGHKACKE